MKLRPRLGLTTLAVAVPMIALLVLVDAVARERAAERELSDIALRDLEAADARERCERDPARFGARGPAAGPPRGGPPPGMPPGPPPHGEPPFHDGPPPHGGPPGPPPDEPGGLRAHRRPLSLFVYDDALRAHTPRAPRLDGDLARALSPGESRRLSSLGRDDVLVMFRTAWGSGSCSYVLASGTKEPWLGALLPSAHVWLTPLLVLFAAVLFAVGPVTQRIRRLTQAVRSSAERGYQGSIPVDGNDEVSDLGRAFRAAAEQLRGELAAKDRRERALRDFLSNTTHDVMIPLTVLSGHLAALRDAAQSQQPLDQGVLGAAMDEAHYMAALVHNLGAAAKLEAEEFALQRAPVELEALLSRVLARHTPIARQLGVALNGAPPDESMQVFADVTLLEQAVSNLVYNAIRHNRRGGHVAVILEASDDGREFLLRVIDDGPGVAPTELSRLGERGFRSSDARQRSPEGQGLGLDIARQVAELHGFSLVFSKSEFDGLQVDLRGKLGQGGGA
ncbi:MAG: HAMP domain-containing sensor histidine kinase [Polyangiaceae bacterium]